VYFLQIEETIQNWQIIDRNSASPSGGAWRRVLGLLRYSDQSHSKSMENGLNGIKIEIRAPAGARGRAVSCCGLSNVA